MNIKNKILAVLLSFVFVTTSTFALPASIESELFSYLDSNGEALNVEGIKSLNKTRNKDIDNAYERYFVAKKNIAVARAAINPISTGLVLGVALGATYLWAPLAINAVLSLPTKFYNVRKNEALTNAEYWFHLEAKDLLANEVAKLYYDILTNEFILRSIDLEVSLYNELIQSYIDSENTAKLEELEGTILGLQLESLNIHDVVVKERAALNTMLSYGPEVELELGQNSHFLTEVADQSINSKELSDLAFENSKEYKAKYWMYHASIKNLKMVRWSLISINGLNFSYGQRVKIAKTEKKVSSEEMNLSRISSRKKAVDSLNQLKSSLKLQQINEMKTSESLNFTSGVRTNYENGQLTLADYIMTAVSSIRNFRNFVVTHYNTMGKIEDFNLAVGKKADYSEAGILDVNNL